MIVELYLKKNRVFYFEGDEVIANSGCSYEISDRLGAGGNGVVYECIDQNGSSYAIKFLLHFTEKSRKRFGQEISLMKRLHHPHIIKYIDDGFVNLRENRRSPQEQQALFVIMEKADLNLKDLLSQTSKIAYDLYAPQFRGLCEALMEIHRFAIHRDIKPENIIMDRLGNVVLIDFSIARLFSEEKDGDTSLKGTKSYAPPEQFGFHQTDARTDIYALGITLNELAAGKLPEEKNCRGALGKFIRRATELDPKRRYSSAKKSTCPSQVA